MARKKNKNVAEAAAEPIPSGSETAADAVVTTTATTAGVAGVAGGDDEMELLQVDLGDMVKMKQVLDEAVAAAILEQVQEDYRWDNMKLGLMTTACVFAMMAQFAPVPFPQSRPILAVCGSLYFILSGILQFITTFIDKDSILLTKPLPKSSNAELQKYGIRVRARLPRFSEYYTVLLEFTIPKEEKRESPKVEQVWSVGRFFDKEGYFDEVGLNHEIEKLFKRFEEKKYTVPVDQKKKQ